MVGCSLQRNRKKCQLLANLCVLQLYDETSEICKYFKFLVSERQADTSITKNGFSNIQPFYEDDGWKPDLPWLYYTRNAPDVLSESKRVKFRVSFGYENPKIGILNKLTYKLAMYDLEGNFYGFQTLTDQLLLC